MTSKKSRFFFTNGFSFSGGAIGSFSAFGGFPFDAQHRLGPILIFISYQNFQFIFLLSTRLLHLRHLLPSIPGLVFQRGCEEIDERADVIISWG
jgi:hypothetical protein